MHAYAGLAKVAGHLPHWLSREMGYVGRSAAVRSGALALAGALHAIQWSACRLIWQRVHLSKGTSTTMSHSSRCGCILDAAVLLRRMALQVVPGPLCVDPRHDLRIHEALGRGPAGTHRQHGVPGSHCHAHPAACWYALLLSPWQLLPPCRDHPSQENVWHVVLYAPMNPPRADAAYQQYGLRSGLCHCHAAACHCALLLCWASQAPTAVASHC